MMTKRSGWRIFKCETRIEYWQEWWRDADFVNRAKQKGKGAPKKKRTAEGESIREGLIDR